ncbi:MAG: GAF and ANTAR domain-containing protein [Acidimicrobiales bacterium]|nr:GAF and ANTAR domain-containing protein [Acidimicrobiales bacterium]
MSSGSERRFRILDQLNNSETGGFDAMRLCQVSAEVTAMSGAGIMLMSNDVSRGAVCTTDEVSALIEDLQFALGEGPCVDAFHLDAPVLEPDLAAPVTPRWPAFTGPALDAGARAVFGFPLQLGAVRLGALNLYRTESGPLTDAQHADSLVMADIAAQALLVLQADAPPGQLAASLEEGSDFQHVVHQASGVVSVQLEVSVGQALIRLRAYAFGNDRRLVEVAQNVVAGRLRFDAQSGQSDPGP